MTHYAAYLGIDWADKKHDLCLVDSASGKQTKVVLAHTPQAIAEYFSQRNLSRAKYREAFTPSRAKCNRGTVTMGLR